MPPRVAFGGFICEVHVENKDVLLMKPIDEIKAILEPPQAPVDIGSSEQWLEVTRKLGIRLPNDFEAFVNIYGSGEIGDFLTVLNPFAQNHHVNLIYQLPEILSGMRELKEEFPDDYGIPLYFEPGGFIPWGMSNTGDIYGWLTTGSQGRWKTLVIPRHDHPLTQQFDLSFGQFILNSLSGKTSSGAIPEEWKECQINFSPYFPDGQAQQGP